MLRGKRSMSKMGVDRELKRGTLEMILLRLLSERPMYGYELVTELHQRAGDVFSLKEGTLYPVLYRLEDAGWIEARWETLERGVPRKYYQLTRPGTEQLRALIRDWRAYGEAVNSLLGGKG
jgi:PadR family transcriptional regulator PadR